MTFLDPTTREKIESLKNQAKYDEAITLVNSILSKNPRDHEALLQIADIQYRKGDIEKAAKAVDFYNDDKNHEDAMGLYLKGVIEMEKNNREQARTFFWQSMKYAKQTNHKIMRCYGLCEYWYGNRGKGVDYLEKSFHINTRDAEVIFNLVEIYLLESNHSKAQKMITHYTKNRDKLHLIDKPITFYDEKIRLFQQFLLTYKNTKPKKNTLIA